MMIEKVRLDRIFEEIEKECTSKQREAIIEQIISHKFAILEMSVFQLHELIHRFDIKFTIKEFILLLETKSKK